MLLNVATLYTPLRCARLFAADAAIITLLFHFFTT